MARHRDGQLTATVRVLFFARYAELVGRSSATIDLPMPATVADVVGRVRSEMPGGAGLPATPLTALNAEHASLDTAVADGDEVALLPPIAGG